MLKWRVLNNFKLRIAGITIAVNAHDKTQILLSQGKDTISNFISEKPVAVDLRFDIYNTPPKNFPPFLIENTLFSTETTWSLYRRKDRNLLWLDAPSPGEKVETMAIIDPRFKNGHIYQAPCRGYKDFVIDPLSYPFDQALLMNLLSLGRGLLAHSCGINYQGQGLLFVGNSGSGKTTMSYLWEREKDTRILSDDRIIIRKKNRAFRIYGTPWPGAGGFARPEGALLKKIYFLKHAKKNKARVLGATEACMRLIMSSFPCFWDKKGMQFALHFCAQLVRGVTCYELAFLPDKRVVDFIKGTV